LFRDALPVAHDEWTAEQQGQETSQSDFDHRDIARSPELSASIHNSVVAM
jgi:hypothetical protein